MALNVQHRSVGPMDNNVYLVTDPDSGERLLIDAAAEPDAIAALVGDGPVRWLLTTHSHHDHIGALAAVVAAHPEATVLAGDADADAITAATGVPIGHRLHDGDTIVLGEHILDVIGLRGHTVGSVAVAVRVPAGSKSTDSSDSGGALATPDSVPTGADAPVVETPRHSVADAPQVPSSSDKSGEEVVNLFTGDSLFPGGVGNTNQDPVRFASLLGDVTARIFDRYDDATVVWPGHGQPTTLGAERPQLDEWRARGW